MDETQKGCPYCGQVHERKVIPFNAEKGVEVVCEACFSDLSTDRIVFLGIAELRKLDSSGYFAQEPFGFLTAIEGLGKYIQFLKGVRNSPPFRVTGSLIIANQCALGPI